jgi:hypothetical protein
MPKPRSQFSAFVTEDQPGVEAVSGHPGRAKVAKSKDPAYMKASVYIRKSTHKAAWEKLVRDERELSDVVELLVAQWVEGRVAV